MGPVTYKIELPPAMKRAHNVFHVSKLKQYHRSDGETGPVSITIDTDGNEEEAVEKILDKKRENRKVYYLVQFVGDPESEAVWMHRSELQNCSELIKEFEAKK